MWNKSLSDDLAIQAGAQAWKVLDMCSTHRWVSEVCARCCDCLLFASAFEENASQHHQLCPREGWMHDVLSLKWHKLAKKEWADRLVGLKALWDLCYIFETKHASVVVYFLSAWWWGNLRRIRFDGDSSFAKWIMGGRDVQRSGKMKEVTLGRQCMLGWERRWCWGKRGGLWRSDQVDLETLEVELFKSRYWREWAGNTFELKTWQLFSNLISKRDILKSLAFAAWLGEMYFSSMSSTHFCTSIFMLIFLGKSFKLVNYFCVFNHKRRRVRRPSWTLSEPCVPASVTAWWQCDWQAGISGLSLLLGHRTSSREIKLGDKVWVGTVKGAFGKSHVSGH